MLLAGAHLRNGIVLLTATAVDQIQIRPHLPVDFFPRNAVRFSDKSHELLQVPTFVDDVLRANLAVRIHKGGSFATGEHFTLIFREQFVAVGALIQVVLVFFEQ